MELGRVGTPSALMRGPQKKHERSSNTFLGGHNLLQRRMSQPTPSKRSRWCSGKARRDLAEQFDRARWLHCRLTLSWVDPRQSRWSQWLMRSGELERAGFFMPLHTVAKWCTTHWRNGSERLPLQHSVPAEFYLCRFYRGRRCVGREIFK